MLGVLYESYIHPITILSTLPSAGVGAILALMLFGQDLSAFKDRVKPLLEGYCVECHGPDTQRAKLRLDTLQPDFRDERTLATWTLVHDKLVAGEMPPKRSDQPQPDARRALTTWLNQQLHAASLERQQKKGRVEDGPGDRAGLVQGVGQ